MILSENSTYSRLKEQVIRSFVNSENPNQILSILKELYRVNINSPRRYEQITTIGKLLRILEIRDVLSENNVGPLKEIALRIPNNNRVLQEIQDYEQSHVPVDYRNYFPLANSQPSPQQQTINSLASNNTNTAMSENKKQRIMETIIDDIGTYWRDLARSLNIKEGDIDVINKNKKVSLKAKCVMQLYMEKKADPQNWFFDLCEALEFSRRRDLAKKIKKISVMNI